MDQGLLQIGVFSRLTHTSVRMLRHYAEHGLLEPAQVDPSSGYRYYRAEQVPTAQLIHALRDAGFTVAEMAVVLQSLADPALLTERLEAQRHRLVIEQQKVAGRLAAWERLRHRFEEPTMTIRAHTTTLPAMTVASLREVIESYADESELWRRLMPQLVARRLPLDGICGATFHDEEYAETDVDVEIWQQIPAAFDATPPVQCRELDAQPVVMATLHGSYDQMHLADAVLGAYVAEHGLETGTMFNIYRISPAQNPDPATWVTDVCLPILPSSNGNQR